jgi:hypothetical protein
MTPTEKHRVVERIERERLAFARIKSLLRENKPFDAYDVAVQWESFLSDELEAYNT